MLLCRDIESFLLENLVVFICRFMVDAADHEKLDAAKQEFSNLLEKPQLQGIPVLVLGNKRDLPNALEVQQLIQRL